MKTNKHIEHILAIAYKRLWAIRNLKRAGISNLDILHFYFMKIRSILESNCVVFHSMLTQEESNDIERVQKIVLRIILDYKYEDYHQACLALNVQNLQTRRTKISLSFALKCLTSEKHKHLFKPNETINIRKPDKFDVPFAHTTRYFKSPKLYLTRLLNNHFRNEDLAD